MIRNLIAAVLFLASATAALAVSQRVRDACRSDYNAYCSAHAVGSEELRQCMRAAKMQLSDNCRKALVEEGEATEADIQAYKSKKKRG